MPEPAIGIVDATVPFLARYRNAGTVHRVCSRHDALLDIEVSVAPKADYASLFPDSVR